MNAVVNETETTETKIVREKRTNWEFDDAANTMSIVELRRNPDKTWFEAERLDLSIMDFREVAPALAMRGLKAVLVDAAEDTTVADMRAVVEKLQSEGKAFFARAPRAGRPRKSSTSAEIVPLVADLMDAYRELNRGIDSATLRARLKTVEVKVGDVVDVKATREARYAFLTADPRVVELATEIRRAIVAREELEANGTTEA